jgi:hypothetical protein
MLAQRYICTDIASATARRRGPPVADGPQIPDAPPDRPPVRYSENSKRAPRLATGATPKVSGEAPGTSSTPRSVK